MRRQLLILAFSLLTVRLFSDNPNLDSRLFYKGVRFPDIVTPTIMTSTIGGHDFLLFIEHCDSLIIRGHYMDLEKTKSDTLPFRLEARDGDAILHCGRETKTIRPRIESMDSRHAKGYAQLSELDSTSFHFIKHEQPDFQNFENKRYQDTLFEVEEISDIPYAKVMGFWSELGSETSVSDKIFKMGNAISEIPLDLHLDVFRPLNDTLRKHPLVMMVHGGSFYFGSKDDKSITRWCRHLASQGYVTASIDYRIGFLPTMQSIGRAGYRAVQDAHAAMRYLVAHREEYGIDTSMLFVGGASAGAITVLNLAYMTNDSRPEFTHRGFLRPELGDIDTCGNDIKADFRIRGIVDMWGAMPDTTLLHGHDIPILAFHGDADDIVPYGHDYPFGLAGDLKTLLTERMYGSSCIVDCARKHGQKANLVTFSGYKHSPHLEPDTKELNDIFYIIQAKMSDFFYNIVIPEKPEIEEENSLYYLTPQPLATSWQVEGGVILYEGEDLVEVAWIGNAPKRSITASAAMPYGLGVNITKTFN